MAASESLMKEVNRGTIGSALGGLHMKVKFTGEAAFKNWLALGGISP